MIVVRALALSMLLVGATACGGHESHPAAATGTRAAPATTSSVTATAATAPAKAVVAHVDFTDSQFGGSDCPADHPLATCFSGTGTAALPGVGTLHLSRQVVSGDQSRSAPQDCEPADTTGTVKDDHGGTARVSGTGTLCGLLATYSLLVDRGTGSLAGLRVTGTITNNGGAETWDVATLTSRAS